MGDRKRATERERNRILKKYCTIIVKLPIKLITIIIINLHIIGFISICCIKHFFRVMQFLISFFLKK